jgi:2-phospho-L-lactate guanylyltransferase
MNVALIPVKRLSVGKSRLLPELGNEQPGALILAMLEDIVEALTASTSVQRIAVITPDRDVAECARNAGAEALLRPDPGLNQAIEAGSHELGLSHDDALLVVLGDVAGARPQDFDALFELAQELPSPCAVLAPSADGGSAALLRRPHDAIPARFGGESAKRHREAAASLGVTWREHPLSALATDIDCAEDVERFLSSESGGPRTRALLAELGWGAQR